ncbi:MAG TPA: AAA family ATPase, partial [Parvularculaceae bacterium]|nr:AAA family ATPase [Parvularculaceae bacterium]
MLTALHIRNFVLIDRLSLTLTTGLTALTGETGAGKSILLGALGLAVGARADKNAIRQGAEEGLVAATFEPGAAHPVWRALEENGLAAGEDQIILKRIATRDGKSRAFINDQPVGAGFLREIGEALLEIHGQHDGRGFLTASTHRSLLDEFGGLSKDVERLGALWRDWRESVAALEEIKAGRRQALAEADYLAHVVDELKALDLKADEEPALAGRRAELMAAEKIAEDLAGAASLLSEDGLEGKLSTAARRLSRAGPELEGAVAPAIDKLEAALSA